MTPKTANKRLTKKTTSRIKFSPPSESEIASCAYAIYALENPQAASQLWREAEAQLMAVRKHDAGLLRTSGMFRQN